MSSEMSRLHFFCNRLNLPADAIEKVRYILDPDTKDEQSLSNHKGGYDEKEKMLYIHQSIHNGSDRRLQSGGTGGKAP